MDSRRSDDKKARKLAGELELKGVMDYHSQRKEGDTRTLSELNKVIANTFNNDNKDQQVKTIKGNNNSIFILNHTQFVLQFSNTRQTAADVDKLTPESPPTWHPRVFWSGEIKDTPYSKKQEKTFNKDFDLRYNHLEEGKLLGEFLSVTVSEYFPTSLNDLTKIEEGRENTLSDEQRIALACDMFQQISAVYSYLEDHKYLWTDNKPGNIQLRQDGSIAIPDKKGFLAYEDVLIKTHLPYKLKIIGKDAKLEDSENTLRQSKTEDFFYIKTPKTVDDPIEFSVKQENGEILNASISNEVLRSKFSSEEKYMEFRQYLDKSGAKSFFYEPTLAKILEAAHDQHQIKANTYYPDYSRLQFTAGFCSEAFKQADERADNRKPSAALARVAFIENFHMEYSVQLAADLYITLTGDDNKFSLESNKPLDFSAPVFETDDGKKLKDLIINMTNPDPANRLSYKEALREINKIRPPIERKVEITAEPVTRKKTLHEFGRIITKGDASKTITPEERKREEAKRQKEVTFTQKIEKQLEKQAGINEKKPLAANKPKTEDTFSKKSVIIPRK